MKNLLKLLLISSSLCACNSSGNHKDSTEEKNNMEYDSSASFFPNPYNNADTTGSVENEQQRQTLHQITLTLLSSQEEMDLLTKDMSDSLTKSGLSPEKRLLFSNSITDLEASSNIVKKQLETLMVSDLQKSQEKLKGIVANMKSSQKELGAMITRLDKITNYIQTATNLIQSLNPVSKASVSTAK